MQQNHPPHSLKPSIAAWLCCVLSVALLGWTSGGIIEIAEHWRKKVCAERILIALEGGNQSLARENLEHALQPEGVSGWFSIDNASEVGIGKYIVMAFEVIVLSEAYEFRTALNRLEVVRSASAEIPELDSVNNRFSSLVEESRPSLESLVFLNDKRLVKTAERDKLLSDRRKNTAAFTLFAKDFADFFTLNPAQHADDTDILIYKEGILAGLPKLVNLEDGIPSLPKLAKAVEYARGKVQVEEGGNAHKVFTQKMEHFRNIADPLGAHSAKLRSNIEKLDSYLESNSVEIKRLRASLKTTLWQVLFESLETSRRPSNPVFATVANGLESFLF